MENNCHQLPRIQPSVAHTTYIHSENLNLRSSPKQQLQHRTYLKDPYVDAEAFFLHAAPAEQDEDEDHGCDDAEIDVEGDEEAGPETDLLA